jgi:hypothetical protein
MQLLTTRKNCTTSFKYSEKKVLSVKKRKMVEK